MPKQERRLTWRKIRDGHFQLWSHTHEESCQVGFVELTTHPNTWEPVWKAFHIQDGFGVCLLDNFGDREEAKARLLKRIKSS